MILVRNIFKIIAVFTLLLCYGCSVAEDEHQQKTICVIRVQFPQDQNQTRVAVVPDGSRDLHFTWNSIDKLQFYAFQNLDGFHIDDLGDVYATNISENGKSCDLEIDTHKVYDPTAPYTLYGVTGCESAITDNKVNIYTYLQRTTLAQFSAPFWLKADVGSLAPKVVAQHVGTYELLHIKNTSSAPVVFKLVGFESDKKWYYDNAAFIPETGEVRFNMAPVQTAGQSAAAIAKIDPNSSATLISWYIPNGEKLKNVTMVAMIDNVEVRSSNKKSSNANLKVGHAYHMYATWDGRKLTFDNGDPITQDEGELEDVPGYEL